MASSVLSLFISTTMLSLFDFSLVLQNQEHAQVGNNTLYNHYEWNSSIYGSVTEKITVLYNCSGSSFRKQIQFAPHKIHNPNFKTSVQMIDMYAFISEFIYCYILKWNCVKHLLLVIKINCEIACLFHKHSNAALQGDHIRTKACKHITCGSSGLYI